jgi:hypothetical protein
MALSQGVAATANGIRAHSKVDWDLPLISLGYWSVDEFVNGDVITPSRFGTRARYSWYVRHVAASLCR